MGSLAGAVDEQAARVLEVAQNAPPLGDAAWDGLLRELGVTPLTQEERQKHFTEGPKRRAGAAPIEVRLALNAIHDRAQTAWRAMSITHQRDSAGAVDSDERKLAHTLSSFVDENMSAYMKRVAPAPTTSSIFANARATTPNYSAMGVSAGMNQMKCTSCGAPRKNERGALTCVYCGGHLA